MIDVCRMCLKSEKGEFEINKPIFGNPLISIRHFFEHFLNHDLSDDERFPPKVCSVCFHKIAEFHTFLSTCVDSEDFLRESFANVEEHFRKLCGCEPDSPLYMGDIEEANDSTTYDSLECMLTLEQTDDSGVKSQNNTKDFDSLEGASEIDQESVNSFSNDNDYDSNRRTGKSSIKKSQTTSCRTGLKYYCVICTKDYATLKTLSDHQRQKHSNFVGSLMCVICDEMFTSLQEERLHLLKHLREQRKKEKARNPPIPKQRKLRSDRPGAKHECFLCGVKSLSILALCAHFKMKHKDYVGDSPCMLCQKVFPNVVLLKRHFPRDHPEAVKLFICEFCSWSFMDPSHLKSHRATHTGEKEFRCQYCAKEFAQSSALKTHISAFHEGKSFHCTLCERSFSRMAFLRQHMRRHNNDRRHKCDLCDKSYFTSSHLKNHVESAHTDTKIFRCEFCDKVFKNKRSLQFHSYKHTKMPFACSKCGRKFPVKYMMRKHLISVHGVEDEKKKTTT